MTELGTQPRSIEAGPTEFDFTVEGRCHAYPRVELSAVFRESVVEGRRAMYDRPESKGTASFLGAHLPVAVTYNRGAPIPFNAGNKGVGLVPIPDRIREYCDLYETTFEPLASPHFTGGGPV